MSKLTMRDVAEQWFGGQRLEDKVSQGGNSSTVTYYGIAAGDSSNGKVLVYIEDDLVLPEDGDGNAIGSNAIELPTTDYIKAGDQVRILANGGLNGKTMSVAGAFGGGDRMASDIETVADEASAAATAAAEAYAAVEATNEHFWADGNGVHVATEADDPDTGPNLLANSSGILLRLADKIRTAMTSSGFAVYDGLGNAAANIVALFGSTVTIGQSGKAQLILDALGFNFKNPFGTTYFSAGLKNANSNTTYFSFGEPPSGATYGDHSFSAGDGSQAADASVAIGPYNTAGSSNAYGIAIGDNNTAPNGVAIGTLNEANGKGIAIGYGTIANTGNIAMGNYNAADTSQLYSLIYGNGSSDNSRSNGYMIDQSGHIMDPNGGTTYKEYVLFDTSASGGTTASTGGTLSKNITGYKYIKVFYHSDIYTTVYGSTEAIVFTSQTNRVNLQTNFGQSNGSTVYYTNFVYCPVYLSGTSWFVSSSTEYGHAYFGSDGSKAVNHTCNIKVDKIVGYK